MVKTPARKKKKRVYKPTPERVKGLYRTRTPQEIERFPMHASYYYDDVLSSVEVKKFIIERVEELSIPMKLVVEKAGINYESFKRLYLKQDDPVSTPALRQSHLRSLLELIGGDLRIQVVAKHIDDVFTEDLKWKDKPKDG